MNFFNHLLLSGAPASGAAAGTSTASGGSLMSMIVPFALIIVIFYFLLIRPQNKKQKETQKMLDALKKGDKVMTIGGVHGTITKVKEKTVIIKVAENVDIEYNRNAISTVDAPAPEKKDGDSEAAKPVEKKRSLFGFGKPRAEAPAPAADDAAESDNSAGATVLNGKVVDDKEEKA
jgi:preprotein translocase subunit YajC